MGLAATSALVSVVIVSGCHRPNPRHPAPKPASVSAAALQWSVLDFHAGTVRVLFKRSPGKKVVAVRLYFNGGTRNLTDENAGIEELTLSTMELGGSLHYPLDKMMRSLAQDGIQLYTAAGQDYSVVAVKTPKGAFSRAWSILTDLVLHPNLGGIALEVQRRRLLAAIASRYDRPDGAAILLLEKVFFAGHPYARRQMGTAANVKRFTARDLRSYYHDTLLDPHRMLLVITGDLEPDQVRALATQAFGDLEAPDRPVPPMPEPTPHPTSVTYVPRDIPTNYLLAYFPAPRPGRRAWAAWKVATAWLSDKLFDELRTKRRLCYAVSADLSVRQANIGYIYLSTRQPRRALALTLATIKRLAAQGISAQDIQAVRRVQTTEYLLGLQTQSAQARLLARAALTAGSTKWALNSPAEIEAVQPRDVKRALEAMTRSLQILVLGPKSVSNAVLAPR